MNYKSVAAAFAVLTVIFAGATAYLAANPSTSTSTIISTQVSLSPTTVTSTVVSTSAHTVTSTQTVVSTQVSTSTSTITSPTTVTSTVVSTTTTPTTVTSTVTASGSPSYSVGVGYKSGIGFYLVNGTGFTLYFRTTDKPYNGTSTCTSTVCMTYWPAFYTSKLTLPPGLNASSFGTITLASGSKQLTYDGYPLYYWHTDTQAGQTNGQGIGNFYACTVPTPTATVTTTTTTTTTTSTGFGT